MADLKAHVLVARAKALLAERLGITVVGANNLLLAYSQQHGLSVAEVARRLAAEELTISDLTE